MRLRAILFVLLAACAAPGPKETGAAENAAIPADTQAGVTAAVPAPEPAPVPEVAPVPEPPPVFVFLVALDDKGVRGEAFGCGDSAVPVDAGLPPERRTLQGAFEAAAALPRVVVPDERLAPLFNLLAGPGVEVEARIEGDTATVKLLCGLESVEGCDRPRLEAQIIHTIRQFPGVTRERVNVNGISLEEFHEGRSWSTAPERPAASVPVPLEHVRPASDLPPPAPVPGEPAPPPPGAFVPPEQPPPEPRNAPSSGSPTPPPVDDSDPRDPSDGQDH